jgi:mRNA interferase MazF
MMENHSMIKHSIVLVPFPFDDFSASKVRPALCLTSEISGHNHVIIAFISSKVPHDLLESDLVIKKGSPAWKGTGLTIDSVIRLHKIVTIPKSLIKRKLGAINDDVRKEIKRKIIKLFENK